MKTLTFVLSMTSLSTTEWRRLPRRNTTCRRIKCKCRWHPAQQATGCWHHQGSKHQSGKVLIAHEAIADLNWPPMTMWFALRDPLPKDIKTGDAVRFELMQGERKQWVIVKIRRK